jgi:hypothetical protein
MRSYKMAKRGKTPDPRKFQNVDANGIGTLEVIDKKLKKSQKVSGVASTSDSFVKLVSRTTGDALQNLYNIYLRGIEGTARVKLRSENNTNVMLGDGKKHDLLDREEKFWVSANGAPTKVIGAINKHMENIMLLADTDDAEGMVKLRKKNSGWFNAADQLVAQGLATRGADNVLVEVKK